MGVLITGLAASQGISTQVVDKIF